MDDEDAEPAKKARRIDPDKIPERAWAAADYLRSAVLRQNPSAVVGTKPWVSGWTWAAGAGEQVGAGSRSGLRLNWANSFRLHHQTLLKAMRNENPATTPEQAWDEISRCVYWLYNSQPAGGPQFVVESPDSLREKWDNVQRQRKRNQPQRGADGRTDTQARHERKQWS